MSVSTAQYVDLLFKKLQGVAKTANATVKGASNESIASPALLRGDIVWTQSDQIPGTAQVVSGVTQGYLTTSRIECTADTTVPTIGGIYPTWLTNLQYWIPQEFGSTWPVKVWVDTAGAANPTVTGTQIFATGIGGVGEFFFDTQAGVLNFIGETIPSTLTAGKSIFITGYRYVGQLGVTNLPSANIGNIQITGNTIVTLNTNGDLVFDPNGSGNIRLVANTAVTGNVTVSGFVSAVGNVTGNYFIGNGSQLTGVAAASVNANALIGDTLSSNVLYSSLTQVGTLSNVSVSGNVTGGNVLTGGFVSATGNIQGNVFIGNGAGLTSLTGANVTGTVANATYALNANSATYSDHANIADVANSVSGSNVSGQVANALIAGTVYTNAQPNITSVGTLSNVSVSGNVVGGNVLTGGIVSATGNITGGNITTSGSGGNITGANVISATTLTATGNIYGNNLFVTNIESVTGNIQGGNLLTAGVVSATSTITGGNLTTDGTVSATGNIAGGNITTAGQISATGNITGSNINVSHLYTPNITNGYTGITLDGGYPGYINFYNGTGTTVTIGDSGNISAVSDITGANLLTSGSITATGNITGGNLVTVGSISTSGNVYGNAILSDNYFYANGQPIPTGIVYTAATTPPAGPDIGDQWYNTTSDVLYEYINDGTSSYWVDTTSPAFAGGVVANVAISGTLVPIANVTYDIGTSTVYFRNTYTQNLYTNNRLPAYNMPEGAVVQTVMSSSLGGSITNSTSYADVSYATVTITPSSATSKVLILATGTSGFSALAGFGITADTQLVRSPSTSLQIQTVGTSGTGGVGATGAISYSYMDSPATTSAVTYKLQQKVSNASSTLTSTNIWLIALEIAAS